MKIFTTATVILMLFAVSADLYAKSSKERLYRLKQKQQDSCKDNLSNFYRALNVYAANNNSKLPAGNNLAGFKKALGSDILPADFTCKAFRGKKIKKIEDLSEDTNPYLYFGGFNLKQLLSSAPKTLLMCDKPDSRHFTVLLADGMIMEINPKTYKRKISNCRDIVELLNEIYQYPPDILKALRSKAKAMDKSLQKK